jgi:hypothetical protein
MTLMAILGMDAEAERAKPYGYSTSTAASP